jgi:ribosomal protein S12 methylthiotransferase accessory factor
VLFRSPTDGIGLTQTLEFEEPAHMVRKVAIEVTLPKGFPEKYRDGLLAAANLCLVKKHLQEPPRIELSAKAG